MGNCSSQKYQKKNFELGKIIYLNCLKFANQNKNKNNKKKKLIP